MDAKSSQNKGENWRIDQDIESLHTLFAVQSRPESRLIFTAENAESAEKNKNFLRLRPQRSLR
jgi:hypothetical protein